jgi:hypothetical protein
MKRFDVSGIEVVESAQNAAYLMEEDALFFGTGYKVLLGQDKDYLVRCAQARWNGRIKIVYFTRQLKMLASCVPVMDSSTFKLVLVSLVEAILDVGENGFLTIQNIDLSENRIFIDGDSYSARIIYLPAIVPVSGSDEASTYQIFADTILRMLSLLGSKSTGTEGMPSELEGIQAQLKQSAGSFQSLLQILKEGAHGQHQQHDARANASIVDSSKTGRNKPGDAPPREADVASFALKLEGPRAAKTIEIAKQEVVLGKSKTRTDCVIDNSAAVSRVHCKVSLKDGGLFVTDQDSANGTFVNEKRILAGAPVALNVGDRLRLADVSFTIIASREA